MIKFKFRLQSILEAREKALEDCQLEMAKVQNVLQCELKNLDNFYKCMEQTKNELDAHLSCSVCLDFTLVNCCQGYICKTEGDIRNQHKIISDIEVQLDEKKREVLEALKAKTMLEKLKEKQLKDFNSVIEHKQMVEMDEIATNRHNKAG